MKTKVAICYDFDLTLSPKDMQTFGFISSMGMNEDAFWKMCNDFRVKNKCDMILAMMYVMIKAYKDHGMTLTKKELVDFGSKIKLFKGVDTWFERINKYAKEKDVEVEHYIVSSGLREMIEGTSIAPYFKKIFASYYVYDSQNRPVWPAMSINYTNKTQYLYRINKGILDPVDDSINDIMESDERPVPFENMIYIGDSMTDLPSMRLVMKSGGIAIGVYQKDQHTKTKIQELLRNDKINYIAEADYSENSIMEKLIKELIKSIKSVSTLKELTRIQKKKLK